MDIKIEDFPAGLLEEARAVYNHYVAHSTATFHEGSLDAGEMREILFNEDPRFGSFALLGADGAFLGYAILAQFKKRSAYDGTAELTIYLKPEATGKGVGKRAIGFLEGRARERGFHALLAVICAENAASVALFSGAGYAECARYREVGRKFGRWLDVVVLEKLLDA